MKIYCEKCKKVFDAEKPADGGQVECTNCKEKVDYPASSTAKGVVIGDFVIERELSKGGMGEVFLARQLSLDRPVALKLLQAKFLNDKEYVEAFFREARAAGRINHPNVIQAYAVGEENGIFYFAMEYIRGKTMKEILKEKKVLDFTKAAQVIKEVASALECAWRDEKLVHQDIKPDNIMLDANGFAKLADLGLARVAGINDKEATEGDEVLGTPQYISPEQLTGVPTDVRSDIYSLGATFYHFVTGRFPYVADTSEEIAQMHVTGHLQPPKEVNPELPDELNTIILKMMSRNIEDRYQTPAPLIKALDMYLLHSQTGSPAVPHLNLRLPKASAPAGGGRPATPFGGAARSPFGGGKTPFAGRAPGGAGAGKTPPGGKPTPAANPPKPAAEPVVKTAVPLPKAVPVPAPVASPKAVPAPAPVAQPKAVPAPAPEEPAKNAAKPDDNGEILSLKVVQKPEKKTPPPEASAPEGKSGKKKKDKDEGAKTPGAGKKVAIYAVCLGIMAICLGGVFYFLAIKNKLPGPVKPFGDKVVAWVKGEPVASPGESSQDASSGGKGGEAEESKEPLKSATRPEYLAGIENLLQLRRSNPEDALGFLKKSDEFFRNYPVAQTPEEQASLQRYLPIYHQVDEIGRVAPARKAAREKFLADLKMRHEAADTAKRESAARQEEEKRRQAQAEAEARNAAEENRRREAEERERFLAETLPKLTPLLENAAESFFPAIRTGEMATFNQAITDLQLFKFPDGGSGEELRLVTLVNSFCVDLPREVKKIRAFGGKLAAITPSNGSFSVEGKDRSLITVVGISPAGVAAVDGSGKPISCDLADARLHTLVVHRLEGRKLENPALYLDMLTGTFSDETAKAAARHDFWKKYYQPFMTAYFRRLLSKASASERVELEKRYGKLPEFRAAK